MITISVNAKTISCETKVHLGDIVQQQNPENLPVAVALNGDFVAKHAYQETWLRDKDCVDIVSPVGGG